jgi:hypothetical protein
MYGYAYRRAGINTLETMLINNMIFKDLERIAGEVEPLAAPKR